MGQSGAKLSYFAPYGHWNGVVYGYIVRLFVYVIPAKELIRSLSAKNHLDTLRGKLAHKVESYRSGVSKRLIHVVLDFREFSPVFVCGYDFRDVFLAYIF